MAEMPHPGGKVSGIDSPLSVLLKPEEGIDLTDMEDITPYLYEKFTPAADACLKLQAYYLLRPLIPRWLQLLMRKKYADIQGARQFPRWPIEPTLVNAVHRTLRCLIGKTPDGELNRIAFWPDGKKFAFVITHDVEQEVGLRNALRIAEIEERLGFISSWNIVPERYPIDWKVVDELKARGFEIGVHGLKHDGKLFQNRAVFERRLAAIHDYAKKWGSVGFRSPAMLRNINWLAELKFEYDSTCFDTDLYEPQPGGCLSIWPFFMGDVVELPLTMPQDHTLLDILGHKDLDLWKRKAEWVIENSGLVLINMHPDYMDSDRRYQLYEDFLLWMKKRENMWHALPRETARWWRNRSISTLTRKNDSLAIRGPAQERASITKTMLEYGTLVDSLVRPEVPHSLET